MKENRGKRRIAKVLILTMLFMVILGANAIAKEADRPIYSVFSEKMEAVNEEEIFFEGEWVMEDYSQYESVDNVQFIDESQPDADVNHVHSFVNTKLTKHKKNSDGSCTVTIYNAKQCTSCNQYVWGDIDNTVSYEKCPH